MELDKNLKSLSKQKFLPKNICLINDGGTVDIDDIVAENYKILREAGSELHFINHRDNNGPSGARSIAVQYLSQWDFIKWIQVADSDDWFEDNFISKKVEAIEKYPDVVLVYSDYWEKDGVRWKHQKKKAFVKRELMQDCTISNNSMFSLDAYHKAGGYDPKLRVAEDWDLWIRLTNQGDAYHIPVPLYFYGSGENSISKSTTNIEYNISRQYVAEKNKLITL